MVPEIEQDVGTKVSENRNLKHEVDFTRYDDTAPHGPKTPSAGSNVHRMSNTAIMLLDRAIRNTTKTKYKSKEKKWLTHCKHHNIHPNTQDTYAVLNFFALEYERKLKWSTIRAYVPALSDYLRKVDMVQIRRLLRGIFNLRPPVAKYTAIWDVNTVLTFLSAMIAESHKDLSMKLATLMMILSGTRVNMLSHMKTTNMFITDLECTFVFDDALKETRPGFNTKPMVFRAFPSHPSLCPVLVMWRYLNIRNNLSGDPALFTTTRKHKGVYKPASPDTIARWIKEMLELSGIDSGKYSAHSCRSASTSAALFRGISLTTIVKSASWSNVTTFKNHYLKEITEAYDLQKANFGEEMLHTYVDSTVT